MHMRLRFVVLMTDTWHIKHCIIIIIMIALHAATYVACSMICVSVCIWHPMNCRKVAELIEMPFEGRLLWAQGTVYYMGCAYWRHLANAAEQSVHSSDIQSYIELL